MSRLDATGPLKVLVFTTLFPHRGEPTLGIFVKNRLSHLVRDQQVEATVIAPVPWFPFRHRIFGRYGRAAAAKQITSFDGVQVYHPRYLVIPKIGMLLTPFFLYLCGKRHIRKLRRSGQEFDVIDAHYLYPDGVASAKLANYFNKPVVMTARGSDVSQIGRMHRPGKAIVAACRAAAHVITVSQSLKNRLLDMGVDGDHITCLRNGVDGEKFSPVSGAKERVCLESGLDVQKPIVLFAGWLIPRKRVDIVIAAIAEIPEVQAVIVGDGALGEELKAQASNLGVAHRTAFLGQKAPDEMALYFSAADLLCLPSEREGWANVMLEALACGTPLVARAVDGAVELISNDEIGRLVDGDRPRDYASAMQSLLSAPTDRSKVREFALAYGWKQTSAGQFHIFREAVTRSTDASGDEDG